MSICNRVRIVAAVISIIVDAATRCPCCIVINAAITHGNDAKLIVATVPVRARVVDSAAIIAGIVITDGAVTHRESAIIIDTTSSGCPIVTNSAICYLKSRDNYISWTTIPWIRNADIVDPAALAVCRIINNSAFIHRYSAIAVNAAPMFAGIVITDNAVSHVYSSADIVDPAAVVLCRIATDAAVSHVYSADIVDPAAVVLCRIVTDAAVSHVYSRASCVNAAA